MRLHLVAAVVSGMVTVGCAGGAKSDAGADTASIPDGDDTGATDSGDDTGGVDSSWWALSATLEVVKGVVVPKASGIEVTLLDDNLEALCQTVAVPVAVEPLEPNPDEEWIDAWFSVQTLGWDDGCLDDADQLPDLTLFHLGVGSMHPEIEAVIDSVDAAQDGAEATLNAAYVSFDESDQTVYVFGVAGTEQAYAAEAGPLTGATLTDGTWVFVPVYLFRDDQAASMRPVASQ